AEALPTAALPVAAVPDDEREPDEDRHRVDDADDDEVPRRERRDQHDREQAPRDADVDEEAADPLPVRGRHGEPESRRRLRARSAVRRLPTRRLGLRAGIGHAALSRASCPSRRVPEGSDWLIVEGAAALLRAGDRTRAVRTAPASAGRSAASCTTPTEQRRAAAATRPGHSRWASGRSRAWPRACRPPSGTGA